MSKRRGDRPPKRPSHEPPERPPDKYDEQSELAAECKKLLGLVHKRCPGLLPPRPVPAGTVAGEVRLTAREAAGLFPAAAALAAGVDRPGLAAVPSVLWREGDRELLVDPTRVTAQFAAGVVVVSIPVFCDQVGDAVVHVTFVVGDPKQPAGLLAATEGRPRGPAVVVDAWGDNLVAFAWHVLLEVTANVAGAAGRDVDGARLVPIAVAAAKDGFHVVPMARHTFDRTRA
jgi:hypothetical protein